MKRMETTEKVIGENTFYIRPFSAFTAANISAELTSVLSPMIGSVGVLIGKVDASGAEDSGAEDSGAEDSVDLADIMNLDMEKALPALAAAFGSLSGDRMEKLMLRLLVDNKNIAVEGEATDGRTVQMSKDLADEVFCGEVQDMFILCYEVIKVNYGNFFKKLVARFGRQQADTEMEATSSDATASLT